MFDKLGINIVGATDHTTRLYNEGTGFCGVTGKIAFGAADCLYLGFTCERAYSVAVDGDLVLSTETADSRPKADGVFGFDIDWSEAAKARGYGKGTLTITNPDAPSLVSTFDLVLDAVQSVNVKFGGHGKNMRVVLGPDSDLSVVERGVRRLLAPSSGCDSSAARAALRTGDGLEPFTGDLSRLRQSMLT